ncbi:MAG: SUMF1/EgtB/PvdO family nonheme iron enzyme [Polyangiaceae bacterium]
MNTSHLRNRALFPLFLTARFRGAITGLAAAGLMVLAAGCSQDVAPDAPQSDVGAASEDAAPTPAEDTASCLALTSKCDGESCCVRVGLGNTDVLKSIDLDGCPGNGCKLVDGEASEAPQIDKYEVTVERYRRFVQFMEQNPNWAPPELDTGSGFELGSVRPRLDVCDDDGAWSEEPGDAESAPVRCVERAAAAAFCIWDGGRLPSDDEWQHAIEAESVFGAVSADDLRDVFRYDYEGTGAHPEYRDAELLGASSGLTIESQLPTLREAEVTEPSEFNLPGDDSESGSSVAEPSVWPRIRCIH